MADWLQDPCKRPVVNIIEVNHIKWLHSISYSESPNPLVWVALIFFTIYHSVGTIFMYKIAVQLNCKSVCCGMPTIFPVARSQGSSLMGGVLSNWHCLKMVVKVLIDKFIIQLHVVIGTNCKLNCVIKNLYNNGNIRPNKIKN